MQIVTKYPVLYPISIVVDDPDWLTYDGKGAIKCTDDVTYIFAHLVGYNKAERLFILKGTKGETWGDEGYFYIDMDDPDCQTVGLGIISSKPVAKTENSNGGGDDGSKSNFSCALGMSLLSIVVLVLGMVL